MIHFTRFHMFTLCFKEAEDGEELVVEGLARVVEDILQLRASIRATLH